MTWNDIRFADVSRIKQPDSGFQNWWTFELFLILLLMHSKLVNLFKIKLFCVRNRFHISCIFLYYMLSIWVKNKLRRKLNTEHTNIINADAPFISRLDSECKGIYLFLRIFRLCKISFSKLFRLSQIVFWFPIVWKVNSWHILNFRLFLESAHIADRPKHLLS